MTYNEEGFRAVYDEFCLFDMTDTLRRALNDFPGVKEADSVLTYGYIDHEAGVTMEILCACIKGEDDIKLAKGNDEVRSFVRIGAIEDVEFMHIDKRISKRFEKKLKTLSHYADDEFGLRAFTELDHLRHKTSVDDILVILRKKDHKEGEGVWVRVEGMTEMFYFGKLLNQPFDDYGYKEGDMVCFRVEKENGVHTAYLDERSDENDFEALMVDDMTDDESDEIIDQMFFDHAVNVYFKDKTDENFIQMIDFLSTNDVIVPFLAEFCEEDMEKIHKLLEEEDVDMSSLSERLDFVDSDKITLKPDILEKGEEKAFFPCYTSLDAMEKYEDCYAKIPISFMDAVDLALSYPYQKLDGMVVNAFTTPVELSRAELRKIKRSER